MLVSSGAFASASMTLPWTADPLGTWSQTLAPVTGMSVTRSAGTRNSRGVATPATTVHRVTETTELCARSATLALPAPVRVTPLTPDTGNAELAQARSASGLLTSRPRAEAMIGTSALTSTE